MKLTLEGIKDCELWNKAGITLPGYDVEKVSQKAKEEPKWVHFGIGNIFRIFIGGIADGLLEEGVLDRAITCVETFDYDVVDKIYDPYDNLGLSVILHGDGTREYKVLGSLAEAVKAQSADPKQWNRLKKIFASKSLQLVSFTITEKGYALQKADGSWFPFVENDIKNGPEQVTGAMVITGGGIIRWVLQDCGMGDIIGPALEKSGLPLILVAFLIAALVRASVGAAVVAMTMAAGIMASMPAVAGLSPLYLAAMVCAITGGATAFSHVNDSGFWLVSSLLEIDEKTTLKSWTMMETIIGFTGLICAMVISIFA